jgi:uncharacterized protein (TIGR03435 family)
VRLKRTGLVVAAIGGLWGPHGIARSQTPVAAPAPAVAVAAPPTFEVASIRPSGPKSERDRDGGPGTDSPTLFHYTSATLLDLVATAWNVEYFQVSSSTPLDKQKFDVQARVPEGATKAQFRIMLQDMLAERFALKAHLESRDFPAYAMVVVKSGLRIKESVPGKVDAPQGAESFVSAAKGDWPELPAGMPNMATRFSMSGGYQLVRMRVQLEPLSYLIRMRPADLPIVDKTGVTGKYSYGLEYTQDTQGESGDAPAPAPDIFIALQEQLGLQLEKKKLPFDVIVVESFHGVPTEN